MAYYYAQFVPSVTKGTPAGDWELFRNAEVPARQLKERARTRAGEHFEPYEGKRVYPAVTEPRAYNDADQSAIMLIWLCREQPEADQAPDEVWHLTNHGGLIRTPWSVILGPIEDDDIREPRVDDHYADEVSVNDWDEVEAIEIWRPPNLEDLAERKVILQGDKRPLTAGAFAERNVQNYAPTGFRQPCPDCNVVPNAFTLECRC